MQLIRGLQCSGCQEKTLFSNAFLLNLNFHKFFKVVYISSASNFINTSITTITEHLHSNQEPNYDHKLSKCDFLWFQTSVPSGWFFKSGWHKLNQQQMSMLNTNRNIQRVLLGNSLKNSGNHQIFKAMEFISWEQQLLKL